MAWWQVACGQACTSSTKGSSTALHWGKGYIRQLPMLFLARKNIGSSEMRKKKVSLGLSTACVYYIPEGWNVHEVQ